MARSALKDAAVTRIARPRKRHERNSAGPNRESGETEASSARTLTLQHRSVGLDENVRALLDWLVDEELKRWQHEEL